MGFRNRYLTVDLRWLGIFRILLGSLLCVEVLRRWYYARAFYTNDGVLPNHFSLFRPMGRDVFSIYHAFSTLGEVSVAFALTLVVFASFTVGFKTKLMHVLSAVCITSLNSRNLFVENGGTVVVNLLTVWTLFLPLGKRMSLDALLASLRAEREQTPEDLNHRPVLPPSANQFVSIVVLALILQWSCIYFFNAVHKSGEGWRNGSALHWFWHQDRIVTSLGIYAREHAPIWLVTALTYATLLVEHTLAFILLVPFAQTWTRRIALLLALGLHGAIALSSRLGPFSYIMTMFFVLLLGERDWQLLGRFFGKGSRKRTVIYDADCGVCLLTARILKRLDPFARLTFVGNYEREKIPAALDDETLNKTFAVIDDRGRIFTQARGVYEMSKALPFGVLLTFWLRLPVLATLGDAAYRRIADNRLQISAWLGLGACGLTPPSSAAAEQPPPAAVASPDGMNFSTLLRESAVVVLTVILATQLAMENGFLRMFVRVRQPEWMAAVVNYPRLFQGWGMFAPEPPYEDGRLVVDGRTKDGRKLDPLTGEPPEFDPRTREGWGHEQFWCDYHNRIRFPGHEGNRQHLQGYLLNLHKYNGRPQDELVSFDVWWIQDRSPSIGELDGEVLTPEKILSHGFVHDSGATPWLKNAGL
ncbi:MAG TPA: DCC1-like thiol-disulfide oxidoreductase family protein [Polyangiaceae bacterium]